MKSFISFVLRLNLNFPSVLIILDKYWGIVDKCTLNIAANLLPRLLFVVELESYGKRDQFVNVYSDMPLLSKSLKIVRTAWCIDFQCHCPCAYPEVISSRNFNIVWSVDHKERRICETQPERSVRYVEQGTFTRSEIAIYRALVKQGDGLVLASCTCQGQIFDIRLAIPVVG